MSHYTEKGESYREDFDVEDFASIRSSLERSEEESYGLMKGLYNTLSSGATALGETAGDYLSSFGLKAPLRTLGALTISASFTFCSSPPYQGKMAKTPESTEAHQTASQKEEQEDARPFFREGEDSNLFSVIIGGDTEDRHEKNISIAYKTLKQQGDTVIIDDPDNSDNYPIDYEISRNNIEKAFEDLFTKIEEDDRLFVYITGHGGRHTVRSNGETEKCSTIPIEKEKGIREGELKDEIEDLEFKRGIVYATGCYSGGIAEEVASSRVIGLSASREDGKAWRDQMERAFFEHLNKLIEGNNEEEVNLKELFEYAKKQDPEVTKARKALEKHLKKEKRSFKEISSQEALKLENNADLELPEESHLPQIYTSEDTDASEIVLH